MRTKTRDLHPQDFSPEEVAGLLKLCKTNATKSGKAQTNPYCVHIDKESWTEKAHKLRNRVYATEDGLNAQLEEARKSLAKMKAEQQAKAIEFMQAHQTRSNKINYKQTQIDDIESKIDKRPPRKPPP